MTSKEAWDLYAKAISKKDSSWEDEFCKVFNTSMSQASEPQLITISPSDGYPDGDGEPVGRTFDASDPRDAAELRAAVWFAMQSVDGSDDMIIARAGAAEELDRLEDLWENL